MLDGSLVHEDSHGHSGVVRPGLAQLMSAGTRGAALRAQRRPGRRPADPVRAEWLRPDEAGLDPSYAQQEVDPAAGLVPLVSGVAGLDAAVRIHTAGAALHVARLAPGASAELPDAPHLHVFVARGSVDLEGAGRLEEGDAARFTGTGGPRVTGAVEAEVLVWQLP